MTGPPIPLAPVGHALTIRVVRGRRSAIVRVDGESGIDSADRLGRELLGLCERFPFVVVDCEGLTFLGSAGLAVLIRVAVDARERRHELRFVITKPAVLAVVRVSGADAVLSVFSSMNEALTD
ncbi:STAS domain-containing protein [Umezawaea sp. Da 62-37]|uniref:STAS domain-containing protein n=1 Tax=Umezawaea sp. Da 62-37 TaxID=3075927 RepID=UPI0028F726EE|nr:STAS domain-containing protein [Umezawaea sp. Da 62-37]WNV86104.1 STAS domain-containing protein [Umezawaea sp. Da 62-37]